MLIFIKNCQKVTETITWYRLFPIIVQGEYYRPWSIKLFRDKLSAKVTGTVHICMILFIFLCCLYWSTNILFKLMVQLSQQILEFFHIDLTEASFPREFWDIGAMYFHKTDKEGRKISKTPKSFFNICIWLFIYYDLWILDKSTFFLIIFFVFWYSAWHNACMFTVWLKIAKHKKDPNTLPLIKKFFGFCFETAYNESPEDELVLLFDMTNTGISNLVISMTSTDPC